MSDSVGEAATGSVMEPVTASTSTSITPPSSQDPTPSDPVILATNQLPLEPAPALQEVNPLPNDVGKEQQQGESAIADASVELPRLPGHRVQFRLDFNILVQKGSP